MNSLRYLIIACLTFFIIQNGLSQPLNGPKTIGGITPDYATFTDAVSALNSQGISGPVIFNVRSGTYNEQISINEISGTSETDTIVFKSEEGEQDSVKIYYSATGIGDNYVIQLDGADFVTIQDLTIEAQGTSYAKAVSLINEATDNRIKNNRIISITTTSNSDDLAVILSLYNASPNERNQYINNTIENGSTGLICEGGAVQADSTLIQNNTLINQYRRGILTWDQDSCVISGNEIETNSLNAYFYGITLFDCINRFLVVKNVIEKSNNFGGYGISLGDCAGSSGKEGLIANNLINIHSQGNNQIGIKSDENTYVKIYYNTINFTGSYASGKMLHFRNPHSNVEAKNNILYNQANGYTHYCEITSGLTIDYNNLYTSGSNIGYWQADISDLATWRTTTSQDANSISVDPYFWSETDLHTANTDLKAGTPVSSDVNEDIDGETRDGTNPCIGADEFVYPALGGTYSIGPAGDYTNFTEAVQALTDGGVRGPVIFNVENGTYTEQITIPAISNSSETNTISFQSASGDSSLVTLTYSPAGAGDNFTVRLNGVQHLSFKNLSFQAVGSDYATIFDIIGGTGNLEFLNNQFTGSASQTITEGYLIDGTNDWVGDTIVIKNNLLKNGNYGVYLQGPSGSSSSGFIISNNNLEDQLSYGIQVRRGIAPKVSENTIITNTNEIFSGIRFYYCDSTLLADKNKILALNSKECYGIYMLYCDGTSGYEGIISNNFLQTNIESTGTFGIGMLVWYSNYQKIVNNTVSITGDQVSSKTFNYKSNCTNIDILNNILLNQAGGYAMFSEITSGATSDYNDLYTNGSYLGFWNGTDQSDLSAWQTASGQDANSLSVDPQFSAADDPHFPNPLLNNVGTPVTEVTDDIDGEVRDATNPDIGADEFCLPPVATDEIACETRTIPDLSATGSNIKWYSDGDLTNLLFSGNPYSTGETAVGTYTYYATQKINESESQSDTVTLTIKSTPGAPVSADQTICYGESTPDLSATGSNIQWYDDAGLTNLVYSGSPFSTGHTNAGEYIYYVTQTENGCESDANTVTLTIHSIPSAPVSAGDTICFGEPTPELSATGSDIQWYEDKPLTTLLHSGSTYTPDATNPGTYVYYVTQTVNNCESPATNDTLIIHPIPAEPVAPDKSICYGETTPDLTATGNDIQWYDNAGLGSPIHTGSSYSTGKTEVGSYDYWVTQTINDCESPADQVTLTINGLPDAIVMDNDTICASEIHVYNIGSAATGGHSYSWSSDPAGFTSSDANPSVTPTQTTKYYFNETIDATGCQNSDSVTITIYVNPDVTVMENQTICESEIQEFQIGSSEVSGHSYAWTSNPSGFTSSIANPAVTPTQTTTYILTETIDSTGCQSTDSVTITINPNPDAAVIADQTICYSEIQAFDIGSTAITGHSYSWSSNPAGFTSSDANPSVTPTQTTTYTLVETIDATGCQNSNSVTITIHSNPDVTVIDNQTICESEIREFQIGSSEMSGHSYAWTSNPSGFTSSIANPAVTPAQTTTYILTETIDSTGCQSTDSVTITINPNPDAAVIADQIICYSEIQAFDIGSTAITGHSYSWSSDPAGFTSSNANPSVTPTQTTKYYLNETIDATSCQATDSVLITINTNPVVSVTANDNPVIFDGNTLLTASGANTYEWEPETGLSSTTGYQVTASPDTNTIYFVTGTDVNGCTGTDSIYLAVYCQDCPTDNLFTALLGSFNHGCTNNNYNNNANCSWKIQPPGVSKIYLRFVLDSFDILPGDIIRIYDGQNNSGTLLGEFDNDNPPVDTLEAGTSMFVEFISNDTLTGLGFQAYWSNESFTGIHENQYINNLRIYPNPTDGILTIEFNATETESVQIILLNTLGQKIIQRTIYPVQGKVKEIFNVSRFPNGYYLLRIDSRKKRIIRKVVLQK